MLSTRAGGEHGLQRNLPAPEVEGGLVFEHMERGVSPGGAFTPRGIHRERHLPGRCRRPLGSGDAVPDLLPAAHAVRGNLQGFHERREVLPRGDGLASEDEAETALGQPVASVPCTPGHRLQLVQRRLSLARPHLDHDVVELAEAVNDVGVGHHRAHRGRQVAELRGDACLTPTFLPGSARRLPKAHRLIGIGLARGREGDHQAAGGNRAPGGTTGKRRRSELVTGQ